jgi:hypothetical protein
MPSGRLIPRAHPVTGTLGWQIITRSRHLALAIAAMTGAPVRTHATGEWQTQIPHPDVNTVVLDIGTGTLWCQIASQPGTGILTLAFAPWPATTVLKCSPATLPAPGQLQLKEMLVTTRMGRTVRYLVPAFTAT